MKPEADTEKPIPPIARSSSTSSAGAASSSKSTGAPKPSALLWKTCADFAERDRVDIKQQAALDSLRLGEKVSRILRSRTEGQNQDHGAQGLEDWAEQFDDVKGQYEKPHSTVGLIGALGAGKTTLLNAILGEQDMLPSSSDRTGKSTACKIVYNHGADGYRAKILFRSRRSFIEELNKLFQKLKEKRDLQQRLQEGPGDTERHEIEDQLEDIDATTSETLETILLLFGLEEEDLNITSTEDFVIAHPLQFLGTTKEINETDRGTFVNKVKPFMDSTPCDLSGEILTIWPLIEHVTIFVKSDILKYGLELLDLPGLGDVVEARSRVAESFSQQLDITAVVATTIRATEEKDVTGLIKKRQETEMRMNGKFDRNSLCVILSKSEDVDPNLYLRTKSQNDLNSTSTAIEIEKAREELTPLRESLKQAAIYIRGRSVVERIQKDFRGREAATKSTEDDPVHTATVEVFPTSARSFQGMTHAGSAEEAGFPTEIHTGIPRLRQWLFEATMKKRENHLDAILTQMLILFSRIQHWISMSDHATVLSARGQQDLDAIHETHRLSLITLLREEGEKMKQIEPLEAKAKAIAECEKEFPRKIDRWRYIYPDKPNSFRKAFGNTQACNLRKRGDFHQSKGKFSYEYQWIDDLCSVFFNERILSDWFRTFYVVVPKFKRDYHELLEPAWERYTTALTNFCAKHNAAHLRDTGKMQQVLGAVKEYLKIRVRKVLARLQNGAQDVHPRFRAEIQNRMTPAFEEAYSIKGEGCVRKRDEVLKQFSDANSAKLPIWACEKMETALEDLMEQNCRSLEGIAADVVSKVTKEMPLLLRVGNSCSSPAAKAKRKRLAEDISPHFASWNACWQQPSSQRDDHVMRGDFSIPYPDLLKIKEEEGSV